MEMNLSGKTILVTGGNGLVGSHLVEELLARKARVITTVRSEDHSSYFFSKELNKKALCLAADITDEGRMREILPKYGVSVIFHLAAQPLVDTAYHDPLTTLRINIDGTCNVLESARLYGKVEAIVAASSDKAYGKADLLPYTEDMPLKGDHPYEASKSCMDIVSRMYAATYKLPVAVTRFGNIYGEGDLNFDRIVPGALRAILLKENLDIRSNGKFIREFIYVKDVVAAYVLLAENIEKTKGEAFNISSGHKRSVLQVIADIEKILGKKISTRILNIAKNEIPDQYLDSSKISKMLKWKTSYAFEEGIKRSFRWYSSYFGGKND